MASDLGSVSRQVHAVHTQCPRSAHAMQQLGLRSHFHLPCVRKTVEQKICLQWHSGQTKKPVRALIRPPYTCAPCNCKRYLWCTHCGGCAFCLGAADCPTRGGVIRGMDLWIHHLSNGEPTMPPNVAHDNATIVAPVVRTPARPKKVHTRAKTCVPTTTTRTTRSTRRKEPPPCGIVGIFPMGIQPERRDSPGTTPPRGALFSLQVCKHGRMSTTFVCIRRWFGTWERALSQGPGQRPWAGVPTSKMGWTCHVSKAPLVAAVVLPNEQSLSIGLFWGWLLSHVYLWNAKGIELYMGTLIEDLDNNNIPVTTKPLGFQ